MRITDRAGGISLVLGLLDGNSFRAVSDIAATGAVVFLAAFGDVDHGELVDGGRWPGVEIVGEGEGTGSVGTKITRSKNKIKKQDKNDKQKGDVGEGGAEHTNNREETALYRLFDAAISGF